MIDTSNAKPLKIENENNRLDQQEFSVIHFAPARAHFDSHGELVPGVRQKDFDRVYVVQHQGKDLYVKLKDFLRIPFKKISNGYTQQSCGQDAYFWKFDFMTKYPKTTNETEMAIYYYERVR